MDEYSSGKKALDFLASSGFATAFIQTKPKKIPKLIIGALAFCLAETIWN